jgi:hypothetical protein
VRWLALLLCVACNQHAKGPSDLASEVIDLGVGEHPPTATHLAFQMQPQGAAVDQPIGPVTVAALDDNQQLVEGFAGTIKVYITANAGDLTLMGSTIRSAVNGVASFDDLSLDGAGAALALSANSRAIGAASSSSFDVTAASWSPADTGLDAGEVVRLFVDPMDPTLLHLATRKAGVFTSRDSGTSWRVDHVALGNRRIRDLAMSSLGTLFAASESGLYQLLRNNSAWNTIDLGEGFRDQAVTAVATRGMTVYVVCAGRLLSSADAGATWTAAPANADVAGGVRIAISPLDDQTIFVSDGNTLVKSTNGGSSFARWITNLQGAPRDLAFDGTGALFAATSMGAFTLPKDGTQWTALTATPSGAMLPPYVADDQGLERLDATPTLLIGPIDPRPSALAVELPSIFLASDGSGLSRFDGSAWNFSAKNLSAARVSSLGASGGSILCATTGGLFRSTDGASTWSAIPLADPRVDFVAFAGDAFALARGLGYRSSDGGAHFSADASYDGCSALAFDATGAYCAPYDPNVNGVYRIAGSRMLLQSGIAAHVTSLASDASALWAATASGLYRSTNSGSTFTLSLAGEITAVASLANGVFAATSSGAFHSSDGLSWQAIDSRLAGATVFAEGTWAAGPQRLYHSADGVTWERADSGLNLTTPTAMAFDGATTVVGTDGAGVYRQ